MTDEIVAGIEQLQRQLISLGSRAARRINRNATNAGLTVIVQGLRIEAPVGATKRTKKSVGKRFKKSKRTGEHEAKAGIHVGKKKRRPDGTATAIAPHAHLTALRTRNRRTKAGQNRGSVSANDWIGRGFRKRRNEATARMLAGLQEGIAKEERNL